VKAGEESRDPWPVSWRGLLSLLGVRLHLADVAYGKYSGNNFGWSVALLIAWLVVMVAVSLAALASRKWIDKALGVVMGFITLAGLAVVGPLFFVMFG
jgi:VIT1/CCC1 family predicted Fe2+/Mn2+ transporter